jgi:serine/threonine-protein kinase RsbW
MSNYSPKADLIIPAHISYLETALSFIENSANILKLSSREKSKIKLATEEAITNIIKHGYSNDIRETFQVSCTHNENNFKIIIHEKGKPFDFSKYEDFDIKKSWETGKAKGLGLFLMKKVMDEIHFQNLGRNGKKLILIKYINKNHIHSINPLTENKKEITDFTYKIRDFISNDSIGISETAYSAYGYSYEAYIYYPSKITEMNRENKLHSAVAVNKNNEVVAHIALKYDNNPNSAEIGVAFVRPEYRGKHIFNDLVKYSIKKAENTDNLYYIFGRSVMAHTYSQDLLKKYNFIATGIYITLFPSDVNFKGISGKVPQKDSALLVCKSVKNTYPVLPIYLPEKHKEILSEIIDNIALKVDYKSATPIDNSHENTSIISSSIADVFNTADIICNIYNDDTVNEIKEMTRKFCLEQIQVIYLFVDITNPKSPQIISECEQLGYFFSGFMPFGTNGKHTLILQYLNNMKIDFDLLNVNDSFAQKIKEYVKKCYFELLC